MAGWVAVAPGEAEGRSVGADLGVAVILEEEQAEGRRAVGGEMALLAPWVETWRNLPIRI